MVLKLIEVISEVKMVKLSSTEKKGSEDWHFLCHLDPIFVEIEDLEEYVKEVLEGLI